MSGTSNRGTLAQGSRHDSADSEKAIDRLTRFLVKEFSAPIGLFDPPTGTWLTRLGAPEAVFPTIDGETRALLAQGPERGRVAVWGPTSGQGTTWLWLPMSREWGTVVAAAGFASSPATPPPTPGQWGPVCPLPALKAWGQSVADRLCGLNGNPQDGRGAAGGGEGVILARLIRRFRISDPPERFQQLACNALRAALGVQAVAWVPGLHTEPVIASGAVGQLEGGGFRALMPGPHSELVMISNEPGAPPDPEIRRVLAVAADSQAASGWLMALNPLDGGPFTQADGEICHPIASLIATQQSNARVYADLKELLFGVIRALTAAIDAKDPYTSGHSERVARIAVRIAEELGMPASQRSDLYLIGLLHDVGKIGVDDSVLKKPGPLTPEEYRQIQRHPDTGVQILADLKKLNHLLPGVRHHHESLDGTGYPSGLAGDAIPWEARILAVADSYDAMSSTRPYRRRLTPGQIDEILQKGSGVQWDPAVIDALFACRMDLELIRQKGLGESLQVAVSGALGRT
jgi:HD-GYP domain-containing protein (c-di-GMP phosphodiesterase class II)